MNIEAYGGDVVLVSITAPGRDRLPDATAMYRWNRSAPARWRDLHRRAREATIRRGHKLRMVSRTWEYQKRGALHVHVVLGVHTARELAAANVYVAQLDRLRQAHDFGFVDRGRMVGSRRRLEVVPSERAARYVAKYLSPIDSEGKPQLSETVRRPDVPAHVIYVDRRLTMRTGCTMRSLRLRRRAWCQGVDPDTGEILGTPDGAVILTRELALVLCGSPPDL